MKLKNEKGFTLIEMLIVLMIISILLLIAVPNMTTNNQAASSKGCEATVKLVQAQVYAYEFEEGELPENLEDLIPDYIDNVKCQGQKLDYKDGRVKGPE
ncbi:competence type IV pilus major pilin ComGC [Alkalihalobacillus sp. MEB130]|uniref:competence type IV pilus major pilin ComGC n=1 Tax=Alkalihalobacillus sp. MEB130 TaxID=2976704 RepID=UPI0028DE3923|nr:competence type IV pilus major pilin ComGC [Alkalihalobacillus sp. MEB130]MDT8863029.1 competence type IV pilus major pilin ComGC [Alkalihalobacillus sp. MEB130]